MKHNKGLRNLLSFVYANFWYVPLLVILIGLKLIFISFLVKCIQSNSPNSQKELIPPILNRLSSIKSNSQIKKKPDISKEISLEWTLMGNLEKAEILPSHTNRTDGESIWLIFNRIPRCGGGTLVKLLQKLAQSNGFAHQQHEYRTPWPRFLVDQEQESLVTWFEYQHLPKSYDRHFYFVNFTKFQKYVKERPIYINMIRDPVLRIRSEFLARRTNKDLAQLEITRRENDLQGSGMEWYHKSFEDCVLNFDPECDYPTGSQDFTLATPFFCGQHNDCVIINSNWASQMAKLTIERHYSVVGLLERMDQTLAVLEAYVPKFFSGITSLYTQLDEAEKNLDGNPKNLLPISESVREILERKLHVEVDLYRFANHRLDLQIEHIAKSRK